MDSHFHRLEISSLFFQAYVFRFPKVRRQEAIEWIEGSRSLSNLTTREDTSTLSAIAFFIPEKLHLTEDAFRVPPKK